MSKYLELREKIAAKSKQLFEITSTMGKDLDAQKVLDAGLVTGAKSTDDVVAEIKRRNTELAALNDEFAPFRELESAKTNAEEYERVFNKPAASAPSMPRGVEDARGIATKTLGQMFVESPDYKAFLEGKAKSFNFEMNVDPRATLFQTSAGFAPQSVRSGRLEYLPMRPIAVIDFIPQIPIGQAADVYMEETTATEAAAERAEAGTAAAATFVWTQRTVTVRSVDVQLPVTQEQLDDVPGMEGILDNRLILAVQRRLDLQVLAGDGNAPNILGTEAVSGIQSQALGADNTADAIYKLFRAIRDDGFAEPEVCFIRAAKWQTWRLAKTVDGIYINGSPSEAGPDRIWGVPVVQTNATTSTKAVAGAYRAYSALRIRNGFTVELGYVNTDFTQRQKTILAGVRAAMVHYRPKAFGQVTGL